MDSLSMAYGEGFNTALRVAQAARRAPTEKRASLFNFGNSDGPYGGPGLPSLSSIVIPLLAAGGAGYLAYNAAMEGSPNRSAIDNIKNYIGRRMEPLFRRKPPAMFDWTSLI